MTLTQYLIALLAVVAGSTVQGALGFGLGLVAAPILALVDRALVPGPLLMVGVVATFVMAWRERGGLDFKAISWALVGRVLGTAAGLVLILRLSDDMILLALALATLLGVALSVGGWDIRPTRGTLVGAGTVSGMMGLLTSIGGPPMALVYQHERGPKMRSTLAGFFLVGASLAFATLVVSGEVRGTELRHGLVLMPGLFVGLSVARPLARVLDRGLTRAAVLLTSTVTSLILVADVVLI